VNLVRLQVLGSLLGALFVLIFILVRRSSDLPTQVGYTSSGTVLTKPETSCHPPQFPHSIPRLELVVPNAAKDPGSDSSSIQATNNERDPMSTIP
jgi:hypothetical protein